jgi:hypothetical protein
MKESVLEITNPETPDVPPKEKNFIFVSIEGSVIDTPNPEDRSDRGANSEHVGNAWKETLIRESAIR